MIRLLELIISPENNLLSAEKEEQFLQFWNQKTTYGDLVQHVLFLKMFLQVNLCNSPI